MKYKVIKYFYDLQDKDHVYQVGDTYPRAGLKPTKKRIAELAGPDNRQRTPLIEAVEEKAEEAKEPKED